MSKLVKDMITKEVQSRFGSLDSIMVVNMIGLDANQSNQVRSELRKNNIQVEVIRNGLTARALKGTKIENVSKLLTGPSAFATGGESIVDVARSVMDLVKKIDKFQVIGAVVEGTVLDSKGAEELSKMPSCKELQGQVVMVANSPGRKLAGSLLGPARKIAGCIKAIEEKREKEGAAA